MAMMLMAAVAVYIACTKLNCTSTSDEPTVAWLPELSEEPTREGLQDVLL
jgi:hypothetical protein